jgi:RNA ligase (TIGR02306 family)
MKWVIEKTKVKEVKKHPNADSLDVVILENQKQGIVRKDTLKEGDLVLFIPDKTIVSNEKFEKKYNFLQKKEAGIIVVKTKLRGELSEGIVMSEKEFNEITGKNLYDTDINEIVDIFKASEYVPPIPAELSGEVEYVRLVKRFVKHDVENIQLYDYFNDGEPVVITEKIHGSQINILYGIFDDKLDVKISSKGLFKNDLFLKRDTNNLFWRAFERSNIIDRFVDRFPQYKECIESGSTHIQFIGEAVPTQSFKYGLTTGNPKVFLFATYVITDRDIIDCSVEMMDVPILGGMDFDKEKTLQLAKELAEGKEQLSGRELHIKEGVVIRPIARREVVHKNNIYDLQVKILNPEYKKIETGEEIS